MKRTASGGKNSRSSGSSIGRRRRGSALRVRRYVLCVKNDSYPASLDLGKLYRVLPDSGAELHAMRRIIDESGEDYLYPSNWFIEIPLPPAAKRRLAGITG
jgi:hypothetical protein